MDIFSKLEVFIIKPGQTQYNKARTQKEISEVIDSALDENFEEIVHSKKQ